MQPSQSLGLAELSPDDVMDRVIDAIQAVRLRESGLRESGVVESIVSCLGAAGLRFKREHRLGARARVDFWLHPGIVIETKKQRPGRVALLQQLTKYASFESVLGIVAVSERGCRVPSTIKGKRVHYISLHALWGVAMP